MTFSRRSVLTGAIASLFMPSIVRSDSLMNLRGVLLDPWALTFNIPYISHDPIAICESVLGYDNFGNRLPLSKLSKISGVAWGDDTFFGYYRIRRLSECDIIPITGNPMALAYNPLKIKMGDKIEISQLPWR